MRAIAESHEMKNASPIDHIVEIGLDKMKFAVLASGVDAARRDFVEQRFRELKERGARPRSAKGKAFKERLSVCIGGEYLLLECSPSRDDFPYAFTCEFNPNPYLRKGRRAIANLAAFFRFLLGHDAPQLLSEAVVSRLDVNVDFDVNVLEGTLVSAKGKRGGANVMCNFDGRGTLNSLYVGVLGSDRRLNVYNKAAETLSRELAAEAGNILAALASPLDWNLMVQKLKSKTSGPPHWRMEVRCLPKPARPIARLEDFTSCFDGVSLLHLPSDRAPFNSSLGRVFIRLARHIGIPAALQALDELDRRRINRAIAKLQRVEWWNEALLRECIRSVLDQLAPLFCTTERRSPTARSNDPFGAPPQAAFKRTNRASPVVVPRRSRWSV